MKSYYANKINYASKEYSETHVNSKELFITNSPTRKRINKQNNNTKIKREIDEVIFKIPNRNVIKEEIENICFANEFRKICGNCSRKKIIAVVSLYVLRMYNQKLKEEEHYLWQDYNLNWKVYSRIISNILRYTRENSKIGFSKCKKDMRQDMNDF